VTPKLANAATAAVIFAAAPLLTSHAMPRLLQQHDYLNLDVGVALAVAAISLNLLLGYTGQISLGHAGLLAIGAFASGIVTSRWHGPMAIGMIAAVLVSAALALIVGLPALRLRGLYLAVVTVVFGLVMQYSVLRSTVFSGGSAGIALPRRVWGHRVTTDNALFLVVCLLLLLVVWAVDDNATRSRVGRAWQAIREDEAVAQSFGIDVTRYKLLAFVVSGGMAGLAGAMYGHAIGFVNSESPFNFNLSLQLVIVVIIGGMGRRLAVAVAAMAFWVLPLFITGLHAWAYIVGAVGLMVTVSRHPEGIASLLGDRQHKDAGDGDDDSDDIALPSMPLPDRVVTSTSDGNLLEVEDVAVRFGGLRAVDGVSLVVPHNRIIGLIGPNGAGKSTLFNAVSGLVPIVDGRIVFRGRQIHGMRADQRARLGIARSFQQVGLAKDLTVRENFLLAQHQMATYGDVAALVRGPGVATTERDLRQRTDAAIDALTLGDLASLPVRNLSGGQQRIVEIACLLVTAPELMLLDEPSAGMAPAAAESLAERLASLRDDLGRTVLLIEHNVPLVLDTCDYVYVLDAGSLIAEGPPAAIATDPRVVEAYYGAALT